MPAEPLVSLVAASERPTAVRRARTSWPDYPALWPRLLGKVHANVHWPGGGLPGRIVMLYRDDPCGLDVEVGVELDPPPASVREPAIRSALPAGTVAWTQHRGPYEDLGRSHRAVLTWCAEQGLAPTGTRWEVYGHHHDDPAQLLTDVFHLLRS